MKLRIRSRKNRRRGWRDRAVEAVVGSRRNPLTPLEVAQRGLAIVAVLLPVIFLNHSKTMVQEAHRFQARFLAGKAGAELQAGRAESALSLLMRAQEHAADEPTVVRGIGWAAAKAFPAQARLFLENLVALGAAGTDDQLLLADLNLKLDRPAAAAEIFEALVEHEPNNPDVWRAWAAACQQRGEYSEAMKACRRLLALAPHDTQAEITMATLLLRTRSGSDEKIAVEMLLGQLDRAVGARLTGSNELAGRLLALSVTDEQQRSRLASALRRLPDPAPEHTLAAILFSYPTALDSENERSRRSELQAFLSVSRTLSTADRTAVCAWLQRYGEHTLMLDAISPAEAASDPALFALRLEGLLSCGLWREAAELRDALAKDSKSVVPKVLDALATVRSCREPQKFADSMLDQALKDAVRVRHPAACKAIGFAALDYGLHSLAARAFASAGSGAAGGSLLPLREYMHALRHSGDGAAAALPVLAKPASAGSAANPEQIEQSIYLRLLCGSELERTALELADWKSRHGEEVYCKFLDALMRYRFGDYAGAVKALTPLPAHRWHQGETIVIASILASGGQVRQAAVLAAKVKGEGVFPEEKAMLHQWESRTLLDSGLLSSVMPDSAVGQ